MSTPQSASSPTIISLASQISHLSSQITTYLQSHSYAEPSLSATLPSSIPETDEYNALRAPLNDAAHELLRLINGPKITLRTLVFSHYDLAALQLALDRKFFYHVPLPDAEEGRTDSPLRDTESTKHIATAAEIAEKAGMDEDRTKRVLRLLATHGIFEEVASDSESTIWKHTANSALFARDEDFYAAADMQMDDLFKAASETSTTIINSPYISNPINSPFHTRFGIPMYQYYEENPKKGARFAQAMDSWSQVDGQVTELASAFPWSTITAGPVVDVGGGSGHISIALARQFPTLHSIVQDISPIQISQSQSHLDPKVSSRISFVQHDFFSPQPVYAPPPSAFLIRQVLHNYNDEDCIKILRNIVPAMERCAPGTPLLINDVVMPESGEVTKFEEHNQRQMDFCMLVIFGAKQRTVSEFSGLLKRADERLEVKRSVMRRLGMGLVEVILRS